MSDAVTKQTVKSRSRKGKAKQKRPAILPDPFPGLSLPTGFETVNEALEDLRTFIEGVGGWHEEDCQRAMTNLALLWRFVDRIECGDNYVMLDNDNPLDHALTKILGPLGERRRQAVHPSPRPISRAS